MANSLPSTYHSPLHRMACFIWVLVSVNILLSGMLFVWLSQPFITTFALCLMMPITTRNHPHTGRCLTNLPWKENTFLLVTTSGISGSALQRFYHRAPSFLQTDKPSILTPFIDCFGSLSAQSNVLFIRCWNVSATYISPKFKKSEGHYIFFGGGGGYHQ